MSSLCSPESFNYLKIQPWCPSAPNKWRNGPNGSLPDDTVHFLISLSRLLFLSPLHQLQLLFFHVIFSCNRSPASPSPCQGGGFALRAGWPGLLWVRSEAGVAQEGGRPSTGTQHITRYFIVPLKKNPGSLFVGWLIGAVLTVMRLCSGRLQAAMWSCRSCWEKFWCIRAASWASMLFPQALFRSDGRRSLWQSESTSEWFCVGSATLLYLLSLGHFLFSCGFITLWCSCTDATTEREQGVSASSAKGSLPVSPSAVLPC